LNNKLRKFFAQLAYVPYTLRLILSAARGWTIAWSILLIVQGVLPAVQVYLVRPLVNSIVVVIQSGGSWETVRPTFFLAMLMAAVTVLAQVLQSVMEWVRSAQAELIRDYLSGLIHGKAISLDLAFYESPQYHDLMERAQRDLSNRPLALLESSGSLLQNSITLLAIGFLLFPYGWWLPVVLFVSTLPAFYVVLRFNRRYHRWWEKTTSDRRRTQYYDMLLTHSAIAAELRLFDIGPYFQSAYQTLRQRLRLEQLALSQKQSLARLGAGFAGILISGVALLWVVWQVMQGLMNLGDLTLFYQSFNRGQNLLGSLLGRLGQIYNNTLFLGNLFEFLELKPRVTDPAQPVPRPVKLQDGIHFKQLSFRYPGSERDVFKDFNLTIPAGKVVAIVGANGAGKSTLIKLLCRLYDPVDGCIELDGINLRDLALKDLRRLITAMFQFPVLYFTIAAENIRLGDLTAAYDLTKIEAAARRAGADEFISRLPQKYETQLGKWFADGSELSGGEWQRLALARAFYRQAEIMILDEPTSLLDSWSEIDWFDRFRELAHGRTAIIITHRFTIAKNADIIYVMDQGQIVEMGDHETLLAQGGRYAQSWLMQTQNHGGQPDLNLNGHLPDWSPEPALNKNGPEITEPTW